MDFFSYRGFLHLGHDLSLMGAGLGLLVFLGWICAPWRAGIGPAQAGLPIARPRVMNVLSSGSWLLLVA